MDGLIVQLLAELYDHAPNRRPVLRDDLDTVPSAETEGVARAAGYIETGFIGKQPVLAITNRGIDALLGKLEAPHAP